MRKPLLFTLLLFLFVSGYCQNFLTIRQVYNFNVGDLFESRMYASNTRGTWYLKVILSEHYSGNNDTLYYTDSVYAEMPKSCYNCTDSSFWCGIEMDTIANLDSSIFGSRAINISCSPNYTCHDIDTLEPYCTTVEFISQPDYSCIGMDSCYVYGWQGPVTSMFYKGVPDGYYYFDDYSLGVTDYNSLIYYNKGGITCGSYWDIRHPCPPNSIPVISRNSITLELYPNPAYSSLKLNTTLNDIYRYDITDVAGRLCISSRYIPGQPINISSLASGYYLINFYSRVSGNIVKQFSKE